MADIEIRLDKQKLADVIQELPGTRDALEETGGGIAQRANAMSAGFRTKYFYDRKEGVRKGNKQPSYASDVEKRGKAMVALVYTANYAAQKDTYEHNTLLKSV